MHAKKSGKFLNAAIVMVSLAALATGCMSPPSDVYIPRQTGRVDLPHAADLSLTIAACRGQYRRGDTINFTATIKNKSDVAYWVPRNFYPTFVWYMPNGQRDGQLPPSTAPREYSREDLVLLQPGESIESEIPIGSSLVASNGIVEYRAMLLTAPSRSSEFEPFIDRRLVSNGYGVVFGRL